ncbi:hypothetical protein GGX14DRAFT_397868 [Mycena pura]|uniref:Uncharacterized protein n=1 Tax=Mycena pura TaxID=153505 RepID=A0AAD6V7M5_9AGAR|nr:hypothetical protein GGX14DRAFT_397868 [Mycena pura]
MVISREDNGETDSLEGSKRKGGKEQETSRTPANGFMRVQMEHSVIGSHGPTRQQLDAVCLQKDEYDLNAVILNVRDQLQKPSSQRRPSSTSSSQQQLLMELLAAEYSNEQPDDGELEGSGDDYDNYVN